MDQSQKTTRPLRKRGWRVAALTALTIGLSIPQLAVAASDPPVSQPAAVSESAAEAESGTAQEPLAPSAPSPSSAERTTLNLLGELDSSSGESRRNENVDITLIDNNVLKELNTRMGTTATIIGDFDVDKGYFGTEFGTPPSEQIHSASRLAPRLRGSAYLGHNNSVFSARSFFQAGDVQPARENDYGANVTFPLWQGGFFSFEGGQRRIRGSVNGNVLIPKPDERTPLATDPKTREIVAAILDAFPDSPPNRTDINPRALNTNAPQEINDDTFRGSFDQQASSRDRFLLRYGFLLQKVNAFQLVKGQNPNTTTRSHDARITWNRVWSPTTISDFSAGFDRVTSLIVADETALGPLIWTGEQLETLGGSSSLPFDRRLNSFRYAGLVRHVRGNHFLTAGFELVRGQVNGLESSRHSGLFSFRSDFTDDTGQTRDTITNLRLGTPSSFSLGVGNTHRGFREWRMLYFLGDRWIASPKLTLDYGLRYQLATKPVEVNALSEVPYPCSCADLGPRFGLAYRLGPRAGTLRATYGLHHGEIFVATYSQARFNPPGNLNLTVPAPDLSDPLAGIDLDDLDPESRSKIFQISPDLTTPYSHQYNFRWELEPHRDLTIRLGYLGSRSHRLLSVWFLNRARPVPGIPLTTSTINDRRPDQRFFEIRRILNGSRGYFDAARADVAVRNWRGLSMNFSYWFSKAIDLGADFASNAGNRDSLRGRSQTEFEVHRDVKALSMFDQPHASLWQVTYQLPALSGRRMLGNFLGNWELLSVVLLKAGTPFSVLSGSDGPGFGNVDGLSGDRPNLVDVSVLGRSVDHPDTAAQRLPKSAFAFIREGEGAGNLGRNVFRKDGIRNINLAISRNWTVKTEKTLTLRAESVNFFNTPQFARPGGDLTGDNFGEITNTLNDGRTFRFLLQFSF